MDNNNEVQLIKIEAVVREEMFLDVKKALMDIGVNGITAYQVVGCGIQRGMSEYVRGQKVDVQVLPKIKFEIVVSSEEWEAKTIEAIKKTAFTGNPGDGKMSGCSFGYPVPVPSHPVKMHLYVETED